MNIKDVVLSFIKGMAIGIANAIPGVSGGTIAFVLGIYERLTGSIAAIPYCILKPKELLKHIKILTPILLGALISIVLFLRIINYMFENYPIQTQIFFAGLIIGSLPIVSRSISGFNIKTFFFFFIGAFIMAVFLYFQIKTPESVGNTYTQMSAIYGIKLFFCGIAAATAMVIPGISGSLLLLIFGEYENVSYFVKTFQMIPIAVFGSGVLIGIFAISKIMSYLLSKYKDQIFSLILGIIIISLISIWPSRPEGSIFAVATSVLSLCLGFVLSFAMDKME